MNEETIEWYRLALAGCGVAAMQNTEASIKDRLTPDSQYYSASYGDVCKAVDREMKLRSHLSITVEALTTIINRIACRNIGIGREEGEILISICRDALEQLKPE